MAIPSRFDRLYVPLLKRASLLQNLQGLVDESSPIYVEMLSRYTKPGRIFDKDHAVFSLIPVCLSSGAIFALATMYRSVATWLTHLENWKHLQEFESQLIMKRFFFDVSCYFFGLFYVAFFELDIHGFHPDCYVRVPPVELRAS